MRFLPAAVLAAAVVFPVTPLRADEAGKAAAPGFDSAVFRAGLPGSWKLDKRQGPFWSSEVKDFRADGTFSSAVAYDLGSGVQKLSFEGTWTLDGGHLVWETSKSSDPASEAIGHKTAVNVFSFSDKDFRYVAEDNPAPRLEKRVEGAQPEEPSATLGYVTESTGFYQPPPILSSRIGDSRISAYVDEVEAECHRFFSSASEPLNFNIITAFRPGKKSRIWIEPASVVHPEWAPLIRRLEAIDAAEVKNGPVGLVIAGHLAGGIAGEAPAELPMPPEWKAAFEGKEGPTAFDEMLNEVWPDQSAPKEQPAEEKKDVESAKPAGEEKKGE